MDREFGLDNVVYSWPSLQMTVSILPLKLKKNNTDELFTNLY